MQKNEITKTIEFAKDVELKIIVELEHVKYHEDEDVWEFKSEKNVDYWSYTTHFELIMNGQSDTNINYADYSTTSKSVLELQEIPEEVKGRLVCYKTSKIINLREETNNKVKKAIEDAKEEIATEESKEYFVKVAEENKIKEINELKRKLDKNEKIIEECKDIIQKKGKLPFETVVEVNRYMVGLNNLLNEGGEGYLPPPPLCQENYISALKKVEEIKKQLAEMA